MTDTLGYKPAENFSRGLCGVDLEQLKREFPEISRIERGKVRDILVVNTGQGVRRVMVTSDRLSAFDRVICTVPGKGAVLNQLSAWWFDVTDEIVVNHKLAVPHPNVLVAKEAKHTLPVEVIVRRYMAESTTTTSVYDAYARRGKREIYGIKFPDALRANEEFPMGDIITPTTKAEAGAHDQPLTHEEAKAIVDNQLGSGVWDRATRVVRKLFRMSREYCSESDLLLVDTKYELGLDDEGRIMLVDEVNTPDSSRYWKRSSYGRRFARGDKPESFDKEMVRAWLAQNGFKGEGEVPVVAPAVINDVAAAYRVPYRMLTEQEVPEAPLTLDDMRKLLREVIEQAS